MANENDREVIIEPIDLDVHDVETRLANGGGGPYNPYPGGY